MKLSKHFTLAEATKTSQPYDNSVDSDEDLAALQRTAMKMEEVRTILGGNPIVVNSWYRNNRVNKAVGGVPNSQHKLGEAVDFTCRQFGSIKDIVDILIKHKLELQYDQLILEPSWVHISFCTNRINNRRQPRLQFRDLSRK